MMNRSVFVSGAVLAAGLAAGLVGTASAQTQILASQTIASGLTRPVFATNAPGDDTRLFVVEQRSGANGRIRVINNLWTAPALNATAYWTSPAVAVDSEQGLLGLAFHPNYQANGYFWVFYTRSSDGAMILARGTRATADTANAAVTTVMATADPATNHNGGWIAFGADGYLYIAHGDGGGGNDDQPPSGATTGNAQDRTSNLLGKILRIDVDGVDNIPGNADDDAFPADANRLYRIPPNNPYFGTAEDDEIFHYGVRNPWRNSFDPLTGDLWIADVGQDQREEITFIPAGAMGQNLGWRCYEATRVTNLGGCNPLPTPVVMPITEYANSPFAPFAPFNIAGCSITGGVVYRGAAMPCFTGRYIFADYCSGDIFSFQRTSSGGITEVVQRRTQLDPPGAAVINNVMSFGTDQRGEIYVCDQTGGEVFRIVPNGYTGTLVDCNNNTVPDACDIANGTPDTNGNGIPDSCEVPTCDSIDFNGDGLFPDTLDIDDFISVFGGGPCSTGSCGDIDFNNDGLFPDTTDIDAFVSVFGGGACL